MPLDVSYVREWSAKDIQARRYSILDLCRFDSFTLIVGWKQAWSSRFADLKGVMAKCGVRLELKAADVDFGFVFTEQQRLFEENVRLGEGGGLLVRPDQHIMLKLSADTSVEEMSTVLRDHIGL